MSAQRTSSYQQRLRSIVYYKQRGHDLEKLCVAMARQLHALGQPPALPLGNLADDCLLNDVNTGQFAMFLLCELPRATL